MARRSDFIRVAYNLFLSLSNYPVYSFQSSDVFIFTDSEPDGGGLNPDPPPFFPISASLFKPKLFSQ
jgi:hypothetical protein